MKKNIPLACEKRLNSIFKQRNLWRHRPRVPSCPGESLVQPQAGVPAWGGHQDLKEEGQV
jgi:hypothetical protein